MTRRTRLLLPAALLVLPGMAACGGPHLSSGQQGYVSGDGTVSVLDASARQAPAGPVSGRTVSGKRVSLADYRGDVVVMPVWGSWCGPCRAEAPMLAAASRDLKSSGVTFLGIDSRDDNTAKVREFLDRFHIPFDSIYDPDGATLLAFHGTLPPMTIPSFVFIDRNGRVAARVLGELDRSTLYGVVEDVAGHKIKSAA